MAQREATVRTNREGHESLAGRRIVGGCHSMVQGRSGEMVVFMGGVCRSRVTQPGHMASLA